MQEVFYACVLSWGAYWLDMYVVQPYVRHSSNVLQPNETVRSESTALTPVCGQPFGQPNIVNLLTIRLTSMSTYVREAITEVYPSATYAWSLRYSTRSGTNAR